MSSTIGPRSPPTPPPTAGTTASSATSSSAAAPTVLGDTLPSGGVPGAPANSQVNSPRTVTRSPQISEKKLDPMLPPSSSGAAPKYGTYAPGYTFSIPEAAASSPGATAMPSVPTGWTYTPPATTTTLYGPSGTPSDAQVKEGVNGDCPVDSPLAAVAAARPDIIKNNLKDNGDGTYTVTLYKRGADGTAVPDPITVSDAVYKDSNGQNLGTASGAAADNSKWASIYEKAIAVQVARAAGQEPTYNVIDDHIAGTSTDARAGLSGQDDPNALPRANAPSTLFAITGQSATETSINKHTDPTAVQALLQNANDGKAPVVANTHPAPKTETDAQKASYTAGLSALGIRAPHNYQVVSSDGNTVTLRDPHGDNATTQGDAVSPGSTRAIGDGYLQVSMADFTTYFNRVTVGSFPPVT